MRYIMQSGVLAEETSQRALAKIKSTVVGPVKKIYKASGELALKTDISPCNIETGYTGDVRDKEYIMVDDSGEMIMSGRPEYAEDDDPDVAGWPICRMPRVDHAAITTRQSQYCLTMHNSQNYSLYDMKGKELLRIMHKGIAGGWNIEDCCDFSPEVLCGIFAFCRYIEQENEFLIV